MASSIVAPHPAAGMAAAANHQCPQSNPNDATSLGDSSFVFHSLGLELHARVDREMEYSTTPVFFSPALGDPVHSGLSRKMTLMTDSVSCKVTGRGCGHRAQRYELLLGVTRGVCTSAWALFRYLNSVMFGTEIDSWQRRQSHPSLRMFY